MHMESSLVLLGQFQALGSPCLDPPKSLHGFVTGIPPPLLQHQQRPHFPRQSLTAQDRATTFRLSKDTVQPSHLPSASVVTTNSS